MDSKTVSGTLYIVATPIGNLEDITYRAVTVLRQVDIIAAEDTRHSKKLLSHYHVEKKLISCHEHNEDKRKARFISHLKDGLDIALITDAGTPSISDPGYKLVSAAANEGIHVIPIPGCSAAIAGLSVSGLPTDSFLFIGFLPKKKQQQKKKLGKLKDQGATLIFYESPKRIKGLIKTVNDILGDRKACLAREITKLHEEYLRGSLSHILGKLEKKESIKGECALFVQGSTENKEINREDLELLLLDRLKDSSAGTSGLAREISKEYHLPKKQIYDLILKLKQRETK